MPVMMMPASRRIKRLSTLRRKLNTASDLEKSSIAMPMYSNPRNTSPSPASRSPMLFVFSFFASMFMKMPTHAKMVTNSINGISAMTEKYAVIVVPMFAPMMIAVAENRDISPALTKPTTMTVVADEL